MGRKIIIKLNIFKITMNRFKMSYMEIGNVKIKLLKNFMVDCQMKSVTSKSYFITCHCPKKSLSNLILSYLFCVFHVAFQSTRF